MSNCKKHEQACRECLKEKKESLAKKKAEIEKEISDIEKELGEKYDWLEKEIIKKKLDGPKIVPYYPPYPYYPIQQTHICSCLGYSHYVCSCWCHKSYYVTNLASGTGVVCTSDNKGNLDVKVTYT